jgi:hypothetical protein
MKICSGGIVITGVANSPAIPVDTRVNPLNLSGSITDGGVSTYQLQYTTSDVFASNYVSASDPNWSQVPPGNAGNDVLPTTGSKPFVITYLNATAIRLSVTTGPATVTINSVFQSDNTLGA